MSKVWVHLRSFLHASRRRVFSEESLLCVLALSPGSLIVMLNLPVLWRDYDSFALINAPPGHLTLLAFPPLYPLLSRIPVMLVSAWSALGDPHSLEIDVNRALLLNNLGLVFLVAAQQLALLFALALLVTTCSRRPLVRCMIIVALLCHPVLFVIAQFVSSEALATILAILVIAIAVHLASEDKLTRNGLIALGLCLYANMMTRHNALVYFCVLPLVFLFGTIMSLSDQQRRRTNFRKLLITSGVAAIAFVGGKLTVLDLCLVLHEPYRSVIGRSLIYRYDLIDRLAAGEKSDYLHKLQARASDPITKQAIPAVLAAKGYWGSSMRVIKDIIQLQGKRLGGRKLDARADFYLNEICQLYYQDPPAPLFADIRATIIRSLIHTTPREITQFLYQNAESSLALYRSNPDYQQKTQNLASCSTDAATQIGRVKGTWWLRGVDPIPCGISSGIILLLGISLYNLGCVNGAALRLVLALSVTNVLMVVGTLFLVPYIPRYILPSCVINAAALAILLGGLDRLFPSLLSQKRSA